MPTATYSRTANVAFGPGLRSFSFNPGGDDIGAVVENVRYKLLLQYNDGARIDLGDVTVALISPDGEDQTIYFNLDGFGADGDDGNDSDSADDYDVWFSGTDSRSRDSGFDGNGVNGTWKLRVDNETDKTLTLEYLYVWVDFAPPPGPDLRVEDISLSGPAVAGEPVTIRADLENIGDEHSGLGGFNVTYYVDGARIGTDEVSLGLFAGQSNRETIRYTPGETGPFEVKVAISGAGETDYSNNDRAETFEALAFDAADLIVEDITLKGSARAGQKMTVEADLRNVGTQHSGLGGFDVTYYVNGAEVGSDEVSFGLFAGQSNRETHAYTVSETGEQEVRVLISGAGGEYSYDNNDRTEVVGADHDGPDRSLANSAEEIRLAAHFVRSVYGDDNVPAAFSGGADNGRDDDYRAYYAASGWTVLAEAELGAHYSGDADARFQPGGLFEGRFSGGILNSQWEAQSLLLEGGLPDGRRALALAFRGTDDEDPALTGQAFSGDGLFEHYTAQRPLIEAALSYANDTDNGIDSLIVAGHSLGGSTADIFAAVDAQRLREAVELTVVSLASAGVDGNVYTDSEPFKGFKGQYDPDIVSDLGGDDIALTRPTFYVGLSHSQDTVTFAERLDNGLFSGLVPNFTVAPNYNFDDAILPVDLPNLVNTELDNGGGAYYNGFGAEHDAGVYWTSLSHLASDPCMDGSRGARARYGSGSWSVAAMYTASDLQHDGCAP